VVERGGLENRCTHSRTQGSNPCLSAVYYVYILQSQKDSSYYYGRSEDINSRFKSHNSGKVRSTKHRRPLKLIYFETFASKKEAIQRELFFKSIDGYVWLKNQGII
jgi:putative endonuclease